MGAEATRNLSNRNYLVNISFEVWPQRNESKALVTVGHTVLTNYSLRAGARLRRVCIYILTYMKHESVSESSPRELSNCTFVLLCEKAI